MFSKLAQLAQLKATKCLSCFILSNRVEISFIKATQFLAPLNGQYKKRLTNV